jgi:putative YphP/YqiW family bacilliredoxin
MYDPLMVQPMRDELTQVGFKELRTPEEVDALMAQKEKTSLVFINSVCGCAAGVARPAVIESLQNQVLPENLTTAFAGNDVDAVERARQQYFVGYSPSSPCAALFREGRLVHMVERHQIEGQSTEVLARIFRSAYDKYCGEEIDESAEIHDPVAELQITVEAAKERIPANSELVLLDVREPNEIERGKIEGALEVDNELGQQIVSSWPRDREIIVYCEHGERSLKATQFLKQQGFENVRSLAGGFAVWSQTQSA